MIIEGCRIIETVLLDGTLGLNAQIAALVMDTPVGGGTPDTRPANPTILNAVDDDPTVREEEITFPAVVIDIGKPGAAPGQIWSGIRDSELDILIAYVEQSGDVTANKRASDYTMRAIVRCLARGLFAAGKRDTAGTRNGYAISKSSKMKYGPTHQPAYGGVMTGGVEFTITMRDLLP